MLFEIPRVLPLKFSFYQKNKNFKQGRLGLKIFRVRNCDYIKFCDKILSKKFNFLNFYKFIVF